MKKTKAYALLLAGILLISLAGCGNTTQPEESESSNPAPQTIQSADVTSATETSDDITAAESKPEGSAAGAESIPAEKDESIPAEPSAPMDTAAPTEPVPAKPNTVLPPPAQDEQPREIPEPRQTEPPKPEEPKPTQPVQPQTPAPAEPKPPVDQPSEQPKEPEFNIEYWISFAKNYAVSIGLELSPDAVECWDNPIIAGAHSKYLERDITDCLNCYKNIEGFTSVWIWAEPDGKGAYKLYIGYE